MSSERRPWVRSDREAPPADAAERAKVPRELSEQIRDAADAALDGTVPRQATLGGVES